jgi:hypothetical protein
MVGAQQKALSLPSMNPVDLIAAATRIWVGLPDGERTLAREVPPIAPA